MAEQTLRQIINDAVADYGFRMAVMYGPDDVIARTGLSSDEARVLKSVVVPELKKLPDPVEPADRPAVQSRLASLALKTDSR